MAKGIFLSASGETCANRKHLPQEVPGADPGAIYNCLT